MGGGWAKFVFGAAEEVGGRIGGFPSPTSANSPRRGIETTTRCHFRPSPGHALDDCSCSRGGDQGIPQGAEWERCAGHQGRFAMSGSSAPGAGKRAGVPVHPRAKVTSGECPSALREAEVVDCSADQARAGGRDQPRRASGVVGGASSTACHGRELLRGRRRGRRAPGEQRSQTMVLKRRPAPPDEPGPNRPAPPTPTDGTPRGRCRR